MAIQSDVSSITYAGNGSTVTPYAVPYRFDDPSWLQVIRISATGARTLLTLGVGYTVTGTEVRTAVAIPGSETLQILRQSPARQLVNSNGRQEAYSTALERQMDQGTMALQDDQREMLRAVKAPAGETLDPVPDLSQRRGTILGFDINGQPQVVAAGLITDAQLVADLADSSVISAASASASASSASSAATSAGGSASAAASSASAALAAQIIAEAANPVPPGPYADAKAAMAAGVPFGREFYRPDFSSAVARYPAETVAVFGDSISDFNSRYFFIILVTDNIGYGVQYNVRPDHPEPHNVTVTHVNPGGTGPLSVNMAGNDLTVTLGRSGGTITSTVQQVADAVVAAYGNVFTYKTYDDGTKLAAAKAKQWAKPESYFANNGPFVWLQAMMRGRFNFSRRFTRHNGQFNDSPVGDWDFGYSGQTAQALLGNPGPLGDVLAADADLTIVCAGANDVRLGATAAQIRDRIVALWDALTANNRQYVPMEVPPQGPAARQTVVDATNALIRPIAAARRLNLIPWDPDLVSGGVPLQLAFPFEPGTVPADQQIHPSSWGSYRQAQYMLPLLSPFIQPTPPDYSNPSDGKWITTNPDMQGNVSGVATGWNVDGNGIITASKVTATDGGNDWQQLVYSQSPGSYTESKLNAPTMSTGFASGDVVEAVLEIECDPSGFDMKGLQVSFYFGGVDSQPRGTGLRAESHDVLAWTGGNTPFSGIIRTPPIVIPRATTTGGAVTVSMSFRGAGRGTVRIRNAGVRFSTQP